MAPNTAAGNRADQADGTTKDARIAFFQAGENARGPRRGFDAASAGGDHDDRGAGFAGRESPAPAKDRRAFCAEHVEVMVGGVDMRGDDGGQ